jgi:hypothetical protein
VMRSNNNNEAITNLSMPERQIPVLIECSPGKAEGFVPSIAWGGKPTTSVRRLLPSFVDGLRSPRRRREIEIEHGAIDAAEWSRLREMLTLIDRLNSGDWSPVVTLNTGKLAPLPALLDRLSPEGWFIEEDKSDTNKRTLRSASGDVRASISFEIESLQPLSTSQRTGTSARHAAPPVTLNSGRGGKSVKWKGGISAEVKTAVLALSGAFTTGLSKTRFVVWWSDIGKKFVPGLYCPDIVTALYALAMWSSGTAGGWAICQNPKCGKDYPRSRAKQRYCSHKCQVAAAMKRMRGKRKLQTEMESKATTKAKKRKGRK